LKKFLRTHILASAFILCAPLWALANQEHLGELKLSDFLLESVYSSETSFYERGFSLGRSYLGATWNLNSLVSGKISFGSKKILVVPARYGAESRQLGIVEGFAQVDTPLGRVRAGLQPIPFGYEGGMSESEYVFYPTLLYQNRLLLRRDYGVSYFISYNDFNTYFTVHNGEAGEDQDERYWVTGRWSWSGPAKSEVGVSGTTGRSLDSLTGVEQHIRAGNAFAGFHIYGLGFAAEGTMSSSFIRGSLYRQLYNWHVDLEHPLSDVVGLQARYDFLEPAHDVANDQVRELSIGFNIHSKYNNSRLYFLASTQWHEGVAQNHNLGMVVWRLNPSIQQ